MYNQLTSAAILAFTASAASLEADAMRELQSAEDILPLPVCDGADSGLIEIRSMEELE